MLVQNFHIKQHRSALLTHTGVLFFVYYWVDGRVENRKFSA